MLLAIPWVFCQFMQPVLVKFILSFLENKLEEREMGVPETEIWKGYLSVLALFLIPFVYKFSLCYMIDYRNRYLQNV